MSGCFDNETYVVYGKTGVCRIASRQFLDFSGKQGEYYILHPLNDERSSIYIPCDSAELMGRMSHLMSKEEIDGLLDCVSGQELEWPDEKNVRQSRFRAITAGTDRRELLRMIRCLLLKKQQRLMDGKKLAAGDEGYLQDAMRRVEEEFSISLGIDRRDVAGYIRSRVEG